MFITHEASADIWFCDVDIKANLIVPEDERWRNGITRDDNLRIIVDSEKGYRFADFENYSGTCQQTTEVIVCRYTGMRGGGTIAINLGNNTFSNVEHSFGLRVTSRVGNCTKA